MDLRLDALPGRCATDLFWGMQSLRCKQWNKNVDTVVQRTSVRRTPALEFADGDLACRRLVSIQKVALTRFLGAIDVRAVSDSGFDTRGEKTMAFGLNGMRCAPGDDAFELEQIVGDGADLHQVSFDGLNVSHIETPAWHMSAPGDPCDGRLWRRCRADLGLCIPALRPDIGSGPPRATATLPHPTQLTVRTMWVPF